MSSYLSLQFKDMTFNIFTCKDQKCDKFTSIYFFIIHADKVKTALRALVYHTFVFD